MAVLLLKGQTVSGFWMPARHVIVGMTSVAEAVLLEGGDALQLAPAGSQPAEVQALLTAAAVTSFVMFSPDALALAFAAGSTTGPVAPGAVTGLTAGTPTATTQPLSWGAPSTGTGPFTYTVRYRLGSSSGAYTTAATGISSTAYTVTGLSAATAYDYQVTAANAAGSGSAAVLNDAATGSSAPVAPGAVTGVTPGTATDTTQPLSWTAPSTGTLPITCTVAYRLGSSTGAYTTVATGVSGTSYTVTGLSASTAYDYQVTPANAAGSGTPGLLNDASTGAAVVATNPRIFYAPANAAGTGSAFDGPFASATLLIGSTSGGHAGTFSTVSSSTNYTWIAVLASAVPVGGIRIFDGTGYGGFAGATAGGIYGGADEDPITTHQSYTDSASNVWFLYRGNGKASTFSTFTLS